MSTPTFALRGEHITLEGLINTTEVLQRNVRIARELRVTDGQGALVLLLDPVLGEVDR